jgi:alkyl hydroperoxide reductase subunit AhpC
MVELGELEAHQAEFAARDARVYVISLEDHQTAQLTQAQFPHLVVVPDPARTLIDRINVIHHGVAPGGGDAAAPTTILVDGDGIVRWVYRPERHIVRLSPQEVLAAIDDHLAAKVSEAFALPPIGGAR